VRCNTKSYSQCQITTRSNWSYRKTGPTGATGDKTIQFQVSENNPNTVGSSAIAVTAAPTTLKTITMTGVPPASRIWLTSTIGWQATSGKPILQFQILRDATLIYSLNEDAGAGNDFSNSSPNHVDLIPGTGNVTYTLTVQNVGTGSATVIGPITFTGQLFNP
jgi:hypothetical protein